jgi:hypothetical protein
MAGAGSPLISRLRGQELARRELARSIYRPSLLARIWHDIIHWLDSLLNISSSGGTSWWGLILLAVAVAAAAAVVLYWLGPTRVNKRAADRAVLSAAPLSAREHRDAADKLAASGNYGGAIIERVRAIVVDLEARDVLLHRPGRTATELAAEAGVAFPAEATELATAARTFNDIRYGGRTGTEPAYRRVRDLDVRLATAAAAPSDQAPSAAALAGLPPILAALGTTDEPPGLDQ